MPTLQILTASFLGCFLAMVPFQSGSAPDRPVTPDPAPTDPAQEADGQTAAKDQTAAKELEAAFAEQGIVVDLESQLCALPVQVCIRRDLLEYVLVTPHGAAHESLLSTTVSPTLWNAALVTLGAQKGTNVRWTEIDPQPTLEERRNGSPTHNVDPPTGVEFFLYVAWREGEETYFYRLEDLIKNLERGRSMQRHGWVYLGSRMVQPDPEEPVQVLAAEMEGNLINLSFFRAGNTLFTACLDDCVFQTIWAPNDPLIPETGSALTMIASRKRLRQLPAELEKQLVDLSAE